MLRLSLPFLLLPCIAMAQPPTELAGLETRLAPGILLHIAPDGLLSVIHCDEQGPERSIRAHKEALDPTTIEVDDTLRTIAIHCLNGRRCVQGMEYRSDLERRSSVFRVRVPAGHVHTAATTMFAALACSIPPMGDETLHPLHRTNATCQEPSR